MSDSLSRALALAQHVLSGEQRTPASSSPLHGTTSAPELPASLYQPVAAAATVDAAHPSSSDAMAEALRLASAVLGMKASGDAVRSSILPAHRAQPQAQAPAVPSSRYISAAEQQSDLMSRMGLDEPQTDLDAVLSAYDLRHLGGRALGADQSATDIGNGSPSSAAGGAHGVAARVHVSRHGSVTVDGAASAPPPMAAPSPPPPRAPSPVPQLDSAPVSEPVPLVVRASAPTATPGGGVAHALVVEGLQSDNEMLRSMLAQLQAETEDRVARLQRELRSMSLQKEAFRNELIRRGVAVDTLLSGTASSGVGRATAASLPLYSAARAEPMRHDYAPTCSDDALDVAVARLLASIGTHCLVRIALVRRPGQPTALGGADASPSPSSRTWCVVRGTVALLHGAAMLRCCARPRASSRVASLTTSFLPRSRFLPPSFPPSLPPSHRRLRYDADVAIQVRPYILFALLFLLFAHCFFFPSLLFQSQ